jgi:hypothetical protein
MPTLERWLYLNFGLRRRTTAARRAPDARKVDRSNVIQLRPDHRGPQRPCAFRIAIEVRADAFQYIKVIANKPRSA